MREIKFRAWDKEAKRIISWDGIWFYAKTATLSDLFNARYELMQYTGLLDKQGKEIYEGDIIKQRDTITSVIWNPPKFELKDACRIFKPLEVIGNIYENPELLK